MSDDTKSISGGCYCGKVRYRADGISPEITECHCSQCRKQAGHRYATVDAKADNLKIEGSDNITWFRSSPAAERGFCSSCGSNLFWKSSTDDEMAILAASIDDASEFRMTGHIFVNDKGAYYEIPDDLPQFTSYDTPYTPA